MAEADGGTLRASPGAFLFALGYHTGGGPIKMDLKPGALGESAVLHHKEFGPCFGYDSEYALRPHHSLISMELSDRWLVFQCASSATAIPTRTLTPSWCVAATAAQQTANCNTNAIFSRNFVLKVQNECRNCP